MNEIKTAEQLKNYRGIETVISVLKDNEDAKEFLETLKELQELKTDILALEEPTKSKSFNVFADEITESLRWQLSGLDSSEAQKTTNIAAQIRRQLEIDWTNQ